LYFIFHKNIFLLDFFNSFYGAKGICIIAVAIILCFLKLPRENSFFPLLKTTQTKKRVPLHLSKFKLL